MSTLLIEGGRRLSGTVEVEGNKNAALPLLAACLLTTEECVLTQRAADWRRRGDGAPAARPRRGGRGHRQHDAADSLPDGRRRTSRIPALVGRLRGSVLLLGPLLARRGARAACAARRRFSRAADDRDASRRARSRWARGSSTGPAITLEVPDGLKPTSIYLYEASVTGTETALLAAAAAPGVSEIRHAACEPHVVELCEFLCKIGVADQRHRDRRRFGSKAGRGCSGAEHRLWGDYIEAGSWAVVGGDYRR